MVAVKRPDTIASRLGRLLRSRFNHLVTDQEAAAARRFGKKVWQEAQKAARETGNAYREGVTGKNPLREAYQALEVPYGSDWDTIKASYRKLIRLYHPDKHAGDEKKQASATKVMQKLNEAYDLLKKHHGQS